MPATESFTVRLIRWNEGKETLSNIRRRVFIEEQKVPEELEWDDLDEISTHIIASSADSQDTTLGTARLTPEGQIGRMAVLPKARHRGIASTMLECLLDEAMAQGFKEVFLHAQTHAAGFYQKHGFTSEGDVFLDAGIPHLHMHAQLPLLDPEKRHGAGKDN